MGVTPYIPPLWVGDWVREGKQPPIAEHQAGWMRSRPAQVQSLLLRFPPNCVVRAPNANFIGVVKSYDDDGIHVGVTLSSTAPVSFAFPADQLELVAFGQGITAQAVFDVLSLDKEDA